MNDKAFFLSYLGPRNGVLNYATRDGRRLPLGHLNYAQLDCTASPSPSSDRTPICELAQRTKRSRRGHR